MKLDRSTTAINAGRQASASKRKQMQANASKCWQMLANAGKC
nr:MAG TPA: hypothetical protein [Caudoviricetes sp.]